MIVLAQCLECEALCTKYVGCDDKEGMDFIEYKVRALECEKAAGKARYAIIEEEEKMRSSEKYEFKIVGQVGCHSNILDAQEEGWEIAGDAKIGNTHPDGSGDKMIFLPMKRLVQ